MSQKKLYSKLLDTINSFCNVSGYKINLQKSVAFLYTNGEQIGKEYKKIIPFTIASKKSIIHYWWKCSLVQPLWKTIWRLLKKTKHRSAIRSSNTTPRDIPKRM
jgi:hypothetical protein